MILIFKQFFKIFKKNIFLLVGLLLLVLANSFLLSSAINLSLSFNNSINKMNNQGDKIDVVSKNPGNFGYLDFTYKEGDEPVTIYTSSLELQKNPNGVYDRAANTFYPYSKNELESRKGISISSGIKYNKDFSSIDDMFSFDTTDPQGIWNYNYGLSVGQPPFGGVKNNSAIAYSFVDQKEKKDKPVVVLNPQEIIYNKYGIPTTFFAKGSLSDDTKMSYTFDSPNASVVNSQPEIYDNNGFGIIKNFFNRSQKKIFGLHNAMVNYKLDASNYITWNKNMYFVFDVFSKFIKKEKIIPYEFSYDLDNSFGAVKTFLSSNPNIFEKTFNKIFYENKVNRNDVPGGIDNNVVDGISLIKRDNKFIIRLAVPNKAFIDYNSSEPFDQQIKMNKKIYLSNFRGYLSNAFRKEILNVFLQDLANKLKQENIIMQKESEYSYKDPSSDNEYLFVGKNNLYGNKVVTYDGNNLINNNQLSQLKNQLYSKDKNNNVSKTVFYTLKKIYDMFPENAGPNRNDKFDSGNNFIMYNLTRYCLNKICELLDKTNKNDEAIPASVYNSPYFRLFNKLTSFNYEIRFDVNKLSIKQTPTYEFNTLYFDFTLSINIFNNYLCVIDEGYAKENNKKFIPTKTSKDVDNAWRKKMDEINKSKNPARDFENWINNISINNPNFMPLSYDQINNYFSSNQDLFNIWINKLSGDYKIKYRNYYFLISGFGMSPDFAFPTISITSPIPSKKNQTVVYLNEFTYNSLNISDINKSEYYTYFSLKKTPKEIIQEVNSIQKSIIGFSLLQPVNIYDAKDMGTIWLRTYFPDLINNLIIIFTTFGVIFLISITLIITYLILKAFIKNLLEPISLCIANGYSLFSVILPCILSFGIFIVPTVMIGYIVSYLIQKAILTIFASIWFVPGTISISFTPLIFLPLLLFTMFFFGAMLTINLRRKFKGSVPGIMSQGDSNSKFSSISRIFGRFKMHTSTKLSISFAFKNMGRLLLIVALSSVAFGGIVSSIVIGEKFNSSLTLTNNSRDYNYQYDLANVSESTGLYKPQKYAEMGMEDKDAGIYSIYLHKDQWDNAWNNGSNNYPQPYYYEQLQAKKLPESGGDESNLELIPNKYLSNLIMPSYKIYQEIIAQDQNVFFNGVASIFLLDLPISFLSVKINIWDFIKPNFPDWLVSQLEEQASNFQEAIMNKYGEWYYNFIDLNKDVKPLKSNDAIYVDNDAKISDSGYYFAQSTTGKKTKPYYVWVDQNELYKSKDKNILGRSILNDGDKFELTFDRKKDFYNNVGMHVSLSDSEPVTWYYIPAFNVYHNISEKQISNSAVDPNKIRFNDEFLRFITTIYGDKEVSAQDSKISFGIIPFDETEDEKYTFVNGRIIAIKDLLGRSVKPSKPNIQILGIKNNSDFIKLTSDGKDILNLINEPTIKNGIINVIINQGAALEYNLDIGETFDFEVDNNSLTQSFSILNQLVGVNKNPINTKFRMKVMGINDDSFGMKFYINQNIANIITGLNQMKIYTSFKNGLFEKQDFKDFKNNDVPFNGIFTKNPNLLISTKSIPFYTFASMWTTVTSTSDLKNIDTSILYDNITTYNKSILLNTAYYIKKNVDKDFVIGSDINQLRKNIVDFININFGNASFLKMMDNLKINELLKPSLSMVLSNQITNDVFNKITTLIITISVILAAIIIPLLIFVTLVVSFSIITDLERNMGTLKILGVANWKQMLILLKMYSPFFIVSLLIGLGVIFAINYGLQYIIFSMTSIFISTSLNIGILFVGIFIVMLIFILSIILNFLIFRNKKLDSLIKF